MVKRVPIPTVAGNLPPTERMRELHHALHVAPKRPPDESDSPPVKTFPGKRIYPTPGQLSIDEAEPEPV